MCKGGLIDDRMCWCRKGGGRKGVWGMGERFTAAACIHVQLTQEDWKHIQKRWSRSGLLWDKDGVASVRCNVLRKLVHGTQARSILCTVASPVPFVCSLFRISLPCLGNMSFPSPLSAAGEPSLLLVPGVELSHPACCHWLLLQEHPQGRIVAFSFALNSIGLLLLYGICICDFLLYLSS